MALDRPYSFEKPSIRFRTTDNIFDEIKDYVSDRRISHKTDDSILYTGELSNRNVPSVYRIVAEMALDRAREFGYNPIAKIRYTFDTNPVQPNSFQRLAEWHLDADAPDRRAEYNLEDVLTSSDVEPTLVAVAPSSNITNDEELISYVRKRPYLPQDYYDNPAHVVSEGIAKGLIQIHQPAPCDAISIKNHFHASPVNNTNERYNRTFWRMILMSRNEIVEES